MLLISIDGLRSDYLTSSSEAKLKIPFLRQLMTEGAYATGVKGVLPSVTYPSHTTVITGVSPVRHGIVNNRPFDPTHANPQNWYWYTEDIRVPTLWTAVHQAGHKVGSISWPVSVGAKDITYNIPEYIGTMTSADLKMIRAISTPGILEELGKVAGPYLLDKKLTTARDWSRTTYTLEMIRLKQPQFMTLHIIAPDYLQHSHGPFTHFVHASLEEVDNMVRELTSAMRAQNPQALIAIVSDHGFSPVDKVLRLDGAFVRAGLINLKSEAETLSKADMVDWIAMADESGGSAPIFLKEPGNKEALTKVKALLDELTSDTENGIASILDRQQIAELGGTTDAEFWIDLKPGYGFDGSLTGPRNGPVKHRGAHGYVPTHPEMNSVFLLSGGNVRRNHKLGIIDMRTIAPTLARAMNVALPTAELPPLDVFQKP